MTPNRRPVPLHILAQWSQPLRIISHEKDSQVLGYKCDSHCKKKFEIASPLNLPHLFAAQIIIFFCPLLSMLDFILLGIDSTIPAPCVVRARAVGLLVSLDGRKTSTATKSGDHREEGTQLNGGTVLTVV